MKNIHYSLFFLCLCFFACNKEDSPSPFRIIDAVTKEGIPNATVELHESVGGDLWVPSTAIFRERTTTNELGEYQFDYDTKDGFRFQISAGADRYWNNTGNSYRKNKTIELDPEGFVNVKVMKLDTTEYARVNINDGIGITFTGMLIDTSFISIQRGNTSISYAYFIYRNGEDSTHRGEEFYVPPHDTTTFEIIF